MDVLGVCVFVNIEVEEREIVRERLFVSGEDVLTIRKVMAYKKEFF